VPSLAEMRATVDRILGELQIDGLDAHRLREVETVLRLLMRHLNRGVADAVNRLGQIDPLEKAGEALRHMRESLTWVEEHRDGSSVSLIQQRLVEATQAGSEVVTLMEAL
jgi:hypothetical protein